jgi:hypothetical protein
MFNKKKGIKSMAGISGLFCPHFLKVKESRRAF